MIKSRTLHKFGPEKDSYIQKSNERVLGVSRDGASLDPNDMFPIVEFPETAGAEHTTVDQRIPRAVAVHDDDLEELEATFYGAGLTAMATPLAREAVRENITLDMLRDRDEAIVFDLLGSLNMQMPERLAVINTARTQLYAHGKER